MRVFLHSLLVLSIGFSQGAPQGYNYPSQLVESELSPEQYQLVQEYLQQQQQQSEPRVVYQQQQQLQLQQLPQQQQSAVNNGGSFQIANQLQQHGQQQQQQQQQVAIKPVQLEVPVRHYQEEASQVFQQPQQQVLASQSQVQYQQVGQTQQQYTQPPQQPRPQFNKEFYYLSAPQDDYVEPKDLQDQLAALKKNLRVVFIRAPEHNGLADAAAKLIKQSGEEQTKIYVLTKQHDASNLANKLNQLQSNAKSPKPEVIFIKYRTPQEAEQAQRTIQEQYQALDGPNHYNFEGVAQTHDFVANTGIDPRSSSSSSSSVANAAEVVAAGKPVGEYLPVTKKK